MISHVHVVPISRLHHLQKVFDHQVITGKLNIQHKTQYISLGTLYLHLDKLHFSVQISSILPYPHWAHPQLRNGQ